MRKRSGPNACIKRSRYQIINYEKSSSEWKVHFALKCVFSIGWVTLLSSMTQSWPWYNWLNSKKYSERDQELISSKVYHYLIISWNLCYTFCSWLIKWYILNIRKSKDRRCTFCYPIMAIILKIASKKGPRFQVLWKVIVTYIAIECAIAFWRWSFLVLLVKLWIVGHNLYLRQDDVN